jgi:ribonuclease VapC
MTVVLDASALLAYFQQEPGHLKVAAMLQDAKVGCVNAAEVISKFVDAGVPQARARALFDSTGVELVAFDETQAWKSGELRPPTKSRGLSLGDRACLALAMSTGSTVVTADRTWTDLGLPVKIEIIR